MKNNSALEDKLNKQIFQNSDKIKKHYNPKCYPHNEPSDIKKQKKVKL